MSDCHCFNRSIYFTAINCAKVNDWATFTVEHLFETGLPGIHLQTLLIMLWTLGCVGLQNVLYARARRTK